MSDKDASADIVLPNGAGRLPEWWLILTPHDKTVHDWITSTTTKNVRAASDIALDPKATDNSNASNDDDDDNEDEDEDELMTNNDSDNTDNQNSNNSEIAIMAGVVAAMGKNMAIMEEEDSFAEETSKDYGEMLDGNNDMTENNKESIRTSEPKDAKDDTKATMDDAVVFVQDNKESQRLVVDETSFEEQLHVVNEKGTGGGGDENVTNPEIQGIMLGGPLNIEPVVLMEEEGLAQLKKQDLKKGVMPAMEERSTEPPSAVEEMTGGEIEDNGRVAITVNVTKNDAFKSDDEDAAAAASYGQDNLRHVDIGERPSPSWDHSAVAGQHLLKKSGHDQDKDTTTPNADGGTGLESTTTDIGHDHITTTNNNVSSPSSGDAGAEARKADSGRVVETAPERQPRVFTTAFTGVSHFDFAMQQRAQEKERRERERLDKEGLARHHAQVVLVDTAAELRKKQQEESRLKKEAEANLKKFKNDHGPSQFDTAGNLKKLDQEQKKAKKEAEEHNHGFTAKKSFVIRK